MKGSTSSLSLAPIEYKEQDISKWKHWRKKKDSVILNEVIDLETLFGISY